MEKRISTSSTLLHCKCVVTFESLMMRGLDVRVEAAAWMSVQDMDFQTEFRFVRSTAVFAVEPGVRDKSIEARVIAEVVHSVFLLSH